MCIVCGKVAQGNLKCLAIWHVCAYPDNSVRWYICSSSGIDAVGTLISVPETTDGVLTVCPGDSISITCTHSNATGQLTRWILPGVPSTCTVVHDGSLPPNCSPFTITMISNSSGSTLSSTAQIVATESLNSARVECLAGGLLTSPQVGNITIRVIGK